MNDRGPRPLQTPPKFSKVGHFYRIPTLYLTSFDNRKNSAQLKLAFVIIYIISNPGSWLDIKAPVPLS